MGAPGQNFRYAVRQLVRHPGFTVTVIVTLALAIGANTAIFSIVNALLLKELPYAHPERMGTIFMRVEGAKPTDESHWIDGEQWELLRDNVPSVISAISSGGTSGVNLQAGEQVRYVHPGASPRIIWMCWRCIRYWGATLPKRRTGRTGRRPRS